MLKLDKDHKAKVEAALEKHKRAKSQYNKQYSKDNEAYLNSTRQRYYAENKEQCLAKQGAYYRETIEDRKAAGRRYYAENKEKISARDKKYYENNKEKIAARGKAYCAENKELISARDKKYRKENQEMFKQKYQDNMQDPEYYKKKKITSCKMRAKTLGVPFDLTFEDVVWLTHCPVFGTELVYASSGNSVINKPSVPSIDRIDSTKGYTLDNVQVISMLANAMKNSATEAELKMFANWILGS